jgi:hypothetical protein
MSKYDVDTRGKLQNPHKLGPDQMYGEKGQALKKGPHTCMPVI